MKYIINNRTSHAHDVPKEDTATVTKVNSANKKRTPPDEKQK